MTENYTDFEATMNLFLKKMTHYIHTRQNYSSYPITKIISQHENILHPDLKKYVESIDTNKFIQYSGQYFQTKLSDSSTEQTVLLISIIFVIVENTRFTNMDRILSNYPANNHTIIGLDRKSRPKTNLIKALILEKIKDQISEDQLLFTWIYIFNRQILFVENDYLETVIDHLISPRIIARNYQSLPQTTISKLLYISTNESLLTAILEEIRCEEEDFNLVLALTQGAKRIKNTTYRELLKEVLIKQLLSIIDSGLKKSQKLFQFKTLAESIHANLSDYVDVFNGLNIHLPNDRQFELWNHFKYFNPKAEFFIDNIHNINRYHFGMAGRDFHLWYTKSRLESISKFDKNLFRIVAIACLLETKFSIADHYFDCLDSDIKASLWLYLNHASQLTTINVMIPVNNIPYSIEDFMKYLRTRHNEDADIFIFSLNMVKSIHHCL